MELQEKQTPIPWQHSLDLDDSDLSSSATFPPLRRCSQLRHRKPDTQRRIPGPASSIQAAMHRNDHLINNNNNKDVLVQISTQEFIRRVDQDSGQEFSRNPWVFAIDSLRHQGEFNATPLKDINNNCFNAQRFHQVVAVVKSCTPNGLGDMVVTLKDPTDTIGASVHRKVVSAGQFGKLITPGSVLVLQKVVAFPSSCASCYLNITKRNVIKVISVDGEVECFPETNLDSIQEISQNATVLVSRRTRTLSEDVQLSYNVNDNTTIQNLDEKENSTQITSLSSSSKHMEERSAYNVSQEPILKDLDTGNRRAWQQNGPELERLLRGNNCSTSMTGKRRNPQQIPEIRRSSTAENINEVGRCTVNDAEKHNLQMGNNTCPSMVENLGNRDIAKTNDGKRWAHLTDIQSRVDLKQDDPDTTSSGAHKKQRLGLISRTSVQEWTDEQLCVLEMDDD